MVDGVLHLRAHGAEVDADQPAVGLHDAAVHHDRVHVGALRLERDVAVGVEQRERHGGVVVLDEHEVGLLAHLDAAELRLAAQRAGTPEGRPLHHLLGAQRRVRDGVALRLRLQVLAGAVGAERGPHGGEQVAAPPHRGVHRQRHGDAVRAQGPGGRVALARALLALGRHRDGAAGRGDAVVGVGRQGRAVDVDGLRGHEAVVVHEPDAVVAGGAPDTRVGGDRDAQLAGHLERGLLRERRVAGDVEGQLEAEQAVAAHVPGGEVAELGRAGPVRRGVLDVAVGQHEPAGHGPQGLDGGLGVLGGLEAVRPVDGRRDTRVERLGRAEQVARVDVLRPEDLAPLQVVPDEVLGQRPVGAVAAHRRLPHVPVGVDHAGHHDAAGRVDLDGPLGHRQRGADGGDPVPDHEHVVVGEHIVRGVHGEHRAAPEHDRSARHLVGWLRHRRRSLTVRTTVRPTVNGLCRSL